YSPELLKLINFDKDYFKKIMNIKREQEKPRKDYEKYSDIVDHIKFFYPSEYDQLFSSQPLPFNEFIDRSLIKKILEEFHTSLDYSMDKEEWFNTLKELGVENGFAPNFKTYKKDKLAYKGHVGDVAEMVRIALTTSKRSPDLYSILHILSKEEIDRRFAKTIDSL
ncbi:MAG: hypothetical protein PHW22_01210, partial [Bacilli bacterium]|nr:hypothetical protein [Bacilli bacterium]